MATLPDDLPSLGAGVDWLRERSSVIPVAVATIILSPLIADTLSNLVTITPSEGTAILGFAGLLGTLAQFLGAQKFQRLDRTLNGAEVILPVVMGVAGGTLIVYVTLPPSEFADGLRQLLRATGLG